VKSRFQNLPFKFNLQRYTTAGVRAAPSGLSEALGAVCFLGEKLNMHTSLWV
jgi:hypothetical protein